MANQDIRKTYVNAVIDLEEMKIYEYDDSGDLVGTHSLQALLEDIASCERVDLGIRYKTTIKPDVVE